MGACPPPGFLRREIVANVSSAAMRRDQCSKSGNSSNSAVRKADSILFRSTLFDLLISLARTRHVAVQVPHLAMIPLVDVQAEYNACGQEVVSAMGVVAASGSYILGPQVTELESKLAKLTQPPDNAREMRCVGVSSGTCALQIALMALGCGPGDEVVTVPFTWISTAEVISMVGATPVFCDVSAIDYNIDVSRLAEVLTPRTRAVIVVSLFGLVPDLRAVRHVLDCAESKHWTRIALIEDGAQSFGATRSGHRSCGSPFVTLSTTSFFPTKPLACYGDGGAVFTQDPKLADAVASIRVHGKNAKSGRHDRLGLNARLDTIQAAVLLVKLSRFERNLSKRIDAALRYAAMMNDEKRVVLPLHNDLAAKDSTLIHVYAVYTVRVRERDAVAKLMKENGVAVGKYYPVCCHEQPVFGTGQEVQMPVAEQLAKQVLALPMHPYLTEKVQLTVVKTLKKCLDELKVTSAPVLEKRC